MASGLNSFRIDAEQQQSPASEGTRPHRPFLLGVLFGGLAVGGLVAVASPGRAEAKFVASPVGVGWGPGASFREVQAAARATGPMMAADTQGNADLLPGRREALATGAAGIAAGVGLLSGASEANAADDVNFKSSPIRNRLVRDAKEIDVNNVDVRAFTLLSDLSEEGAKKLAANAPYKGLTDMYARAGFSEAEKTSIKKYEQQLLFGNPKGKYTIQK